MPAAAELPLPFLTAEAARVGVMLTPVQLTQCERYAALLLERNGTVNLTAITDPVEVARKHFLDSFTALAARHWSGRERVVDVGSGAGFPGLALRIALPGIRVSLIESVGKKARFLEEVVALLGLDGVEVSNERAEELGRTRRGVYDVGTIRAVGSIGADLEYLLPFLRVGGDAIIWKGRIDAEQVGAERALAELGGGPLQITATVAIGLGDVLPGRHLVVARKVRVTPERYPRRALDMRKRPW